jgi:Family of unknown function (DUF5985)
MEAVLQFLYGGLTMMCAAVGLFFVRYWWLQRDRLFLWFAAAFWSFGMSWGVHLVFATSMETGPNVYVFRVVGFLLIIAAIVDKNRRASAEHRGPAGEDR